MLCFVIYHAQFVVEQNVNECQCKKMKNWLREKLIFPKHKQRIMGERKKMKIIDETKNNLEIC